MGRPIDNKLNFNDHVAKLCKKASQKLHALARIAQYINPIKLRILMKAFIESQFNYCPLIWMFHNRLLNNRINRIHERALRIVYNANESLFAYLLRKDKGFSIYKRLATACVSVCLCVHHADFSAVLSRFWKFEVLLEPAQQGDDVF